MNSVQFIFSTTIYRTLLLSIFTILLPWFSNELQAQAKPEEFISKLSSEIVNTRDDSLKIEKLAELAYYYSDYLGDKAAADSVCQKSIDLAEASYRPGLLLLAYNRYIECVDAGLYPDKALGYALEAVKLGKLENKPGLEWRSYSNLVAVYLSGYKYDKALGCSYQALAIADALEDAKLKSESYLLIGQSLEGNNQKIEAFRNYLNATALAEKINSKALLKKCYSQLSAFYNSNKLYDKAIIYKLRQVDLISNEQPVDSVELMWAQYYLQVINVNSNNNKLNATSMQDVLDFAIRTNNTRLKNYEIALYRSYLIQADKINQLYTFYNKQYPEELLRLSRENPALYFRLLAYFNEEENRPDSAYMNLLKAEKLIESDPNKILRSNFYQRFGQFFVRQRKPKEAISKYLESYNLANEASYFEYMLSSSKNLQELYAEIGDYKNAYTYSALNKALADSINLLTQNDQLLMLEIDHETHQRELAAEQENEQTHRRHNIQYTAITIITITMFIVLLMLGSLKVPSWTIKMLGFFSFILLFEFIIMIADHKIYEITANEPWKILLIKIGLIAFLLPFHHWIEKKVIHFLIEKKLIKIPRFSLSRILRSHKNTTEQPEAAEL
jgi:hypothetical protein